MTQLTSTNTGGFDDIDMSGLDFLEIEVVQTSGATGIPETGASCCWYFACGCSSCYADEQPTVG
jgi:hypothetical protein